MSDKQETIADIIAEMHRFAKQHEYDHPDMDTNARGIEDYADRLEAAHERELVTKPAENVNSGAAIDTAGNSGDAAKLREALELARLYISLGPKAQSRAYVKDGEAVMLFAIDVLDELSAALFAPPRNCDRFATVEDARKAHEAICEKYGKCHNGCPLNNEEHYSAFDCFEAWLFAPATEQKGETDGN